MFLAKVLTAHGRMFPFPFLLCPSLSLSLYSLLPRLLAFRLTLAKCSPQGPVRVGQVFVSEAIESKFHYYRQHHPI